MEEKEEIGWKQRLNLESAKNNTNINRLPTIFVCSLSAVPKHLIIALGYPSSLPSRYLVITLLWK